MAVQLAESLLYYASTAHRGSVTSLTQRAYIKPKVVTYEVANPKMPRATGKRPSNPSRRSDSANNYGRTKAHRNGGLPFSSIICSHPAVSQQSHGINSSTPSPSFQGVANCASAPVEATPNNTDLVSITRVPHLPPRRPLRREYAFILQPSSPLLHKARTSIMSSCEAGTKDERNNLPLPALNLVSTRMLILAASLHFVLIYTLSHFCFKWL